ncbi:hypothetical protein AHF37_05997 [Paragonimus kellicotti]|nr:hypothetical protein AHF37_05997 [Paragonimus kellicotti]
MPPKPLTKDKKKEEEERKRQEEEEARLLAEEEEKARQLREREERRLRKINEKEELKQRKVELDETRELLQEHRIRLEQLESERRADYAWKRYFRCDGSPNPSIEKEVNTFMSLWRLDESRLTMEEVMDESVHSLKLIDELRTLVADIGDNEEDAQTLLTYQRLRQLVHEKLDRATVETLSRAVHYADHETSNLQRTWRNDWIAICIWANLSKNPRIRQFTFADVDITFDIPKFLTLSDCSFLISFMKFDNYSVECASSVPHKVNKTNSLIDTKPIEESANKTPVPDLDIVDKITTEEPHTNFFSESDKMSPSEDVDETAAETEEVIEPPPEDLVPTPGCIEKEVNTFMSLWRLDESRLTMEEVMDESVHSLKLIDELRTLVADIGDNEEDAQTLLTYQRVCLSNTLSYRRPCTSYVNLFTKKLDRATVETLSRAVHYADHETSNLQRTWRNDWIAICIWANLSKNPRIRQFTFADVDITFDIPKFLTLSDCSFSDFFYENFFSESDKMSPSEDVDETAAETEEVIEPPPEDLVPTPGW